jgi:hypothetical protein
MWRFDGDCAVINDSSATASVMPLKQALILIAEDEVEIAEILAAYFERNGLHAPCMPETGVRPWFASQP